MGSPGNIMVPIAFFSWVPFVIFLYRKVEKRLVPVIAYVVGWMFLPCANYDLFMLHNTKTSVIGYGLLAGAWMFDKERLLNYSFDKVDIPMILWCTAPFFSSVANGLGVYDGLSSMLYVTIRWGIPYYLGRVYFSEVDILKTLALTIFIGGLVYVPFSLFELKMSPQLHRLTYGFHQHDFLQTMKEGGGFRPMLYMEHGLMAAMWMVLASLFGCWLYFTGNLPRKILSFSSTGLLVVLVLTTLMFKSMAAIIFFVVGLLALYLGVKSKKPILVIVLLLIPYPYIMLKSTGRWNGSDLSSFIGAKTTAERAQSLQFRFDNETLLINRARDGGFFGWGGFGRSRVFDDEGRDLTVTDGQWIIVYGTNGMYGLIWLVLTVQLPAFLFIRKTKAEEWGSKQLAAPAAMAVFTAITMVDNLLNAMINPIYMIIGGGLLGMLIKAPGTTLGSIMENELDLFREIESCRSRFLSDASNSPSKFIA